MQFKIKSYVRRMGRMSPRQEHAFKHYLPEYQLVREASPWSFKDIFQRDAETYVEIGFGMGKSLVQMAEAHPTLNFIGIEVHEPGIGQLLADLHDKAITNVRVVMDDAAAIFSEGCIPAHSLTGVHIFFPDPWPKRRHHKRRLIQPEFIQRVIKTLHPGGHIHCATDWEDYALHIKSVLSGTPGLTENVTSNKVLARPGTKFEARGRRLGHGVWDLIYQLPLA